MAGITRHHKAPDRGGAAARESADKQLLRAARNVASLLRERRRLNRRLKDIKHDLKLARAELKTLIARLSPDNGPDVAPMRLFSGAAGMRAPRAEPVDRAPASEATNAFVDALGKDDEP